MATQITGHVRTHTADNTIAKNILVKRTSTGVDVATAATDKICGVSLNAAATGEQVAVQFTGTVKVQASTSISAGAWVTATTAGQAVTTTTDHHVVLGMALGAATAQNDLIEIQLGIMTLSA